MPPFLSGREACGKASARLADDGKKGGSAWIAVAVFAGVVWNGAHDFHRFFSAWLHLYA